MFTVKANLTLYVNSCKVVRLVWGSQKSLSFTKYSLTKYYGSYKKVVF